MNNENAKQEKHYPEIYSVRGDIGKVAASLELPSEGRLAICGGRWSGALLRALLPSHDKAYIIDKTAFADTRAVIGIGGPESLLRAANAAKKLGSKLYLIPTTCKPVPSGVSPKPYAVSAFSDAVSSGDEAEVCGGFGSLAANILSLTEKRIAATLYRETDAPKSRKKGIGVIIQALEELERNEYGLAAAAEIISDANLKLFALQCVSGPTTDSAEAVSSLMDILEQERTVGGKSSGNSTEKSLRNADVAPQNRSRAKIPDGEKTFLVAIILTRYYLMRLTDPSVEFLPPPSQNERLSALSRLLNKPESELSDKFLQSETSFDMLEPRLREYADDFIELLRDADNLNLRALKILRRLRFDCGKGLNIINPSFLSVGIALGAEVCREKGLLHALRNRGEFESLYKNIV